MSRIGHNVPLEGFEHVTKMLKESAGEDGIISATTPRSLGRPYARMAAGPRPTPPVKCIAWWISLKMRRAPE